MRHEISVARDNGNIEMIAVYVNDNPAKESLIDYCVGYLFKLPGKILEKKYRERAKLYMYEGPRMWHLQWSDGVYSVRK